MGNKINKPEKEEIINQNIFQYYIYQPGTINLYNINSKNKNLEGKTPKDILESININSKNIKCIKVNCGGTIAMSKNFPPKTNNVYKFKLCNMDFPLFLLDYKHPLSIIVETEEKVDVNVVENHREPKEHELVWKDHKKITLPLYDCHYKNITFRQGLMIFK